MNGPARVAAVLFLASFACKAEQRSPRAEEPNEATAQPPEPDFEPPPVINDGTLLTPYLALGDTLAADLSEGLDAAAKALEQATASRIHEPGVEQLRAASGRIADGDLEAARASYREVSDALLLYLDADAAAREGLTLVYCPMTFDGTGGYWVQRGEKIRNPYEGSRMLECGSVLEWSAGVAHRERRAAAKP